MHRRVIRSLATIAQTSTQSVKSTRSIKQTSLFASVFTAASQSSRFFHSSTVKMSSSSASTILPISAPVNQLTSATASARPEHVGIHAMDMYFPKNYVRQSDLEQHNGVSAGKYTIGLGQSNLAFCTDREDIYSMCLSAVARFMEEYKIPYEWIGRLEVGSETILDHSKAIKTHLMTLFEPSGNTDIEGVDTTNACYGGTNALFNSLSWIESSAWDGRYALVVTADIAEYADGPARPTGGAGAVVMLIGPNAPLAIERPRATHVENAWDFYKPNLSSPYPVVDGKFSNSCYLRALDKCFERYSSKFNSTIGGDFSLDQADYIMCHAPYNKLVQKALGRLYYNEFLDHVNKPEFASLQKFASIPKDQTYADAELDKASVALSKAQYAQKTAPSTLIPQNLGNLYTASLYAGLMSLLTTKTDDLPGKRLLMFSYGSGLVASLFSFRVRDDAVSRQQLKLVASTSNINARLEDRNAVSPTVFNEWMSVREKLHHDNAFVPNGEVNAKEFFPGAFYLLERDADGKRTYARFPKA